MADSSGAGRRVSPRSGRTVSAPTLVVAVSAVAAAVFAATQARRLYFFGDDWAFLLHRSITWSDLMDPHNEHWSALPVLAFRTMVSIFGIDHYLAYGLMPILLHVLCCSLLYALMRRCEVPSWPAALLVVAMLFLVGGIGENPLWDFQIGFLGSAALGLVALLLATHDTRGALVASWLVMVACFACSGMAIAMIAWLGGFVLVHRGLRRALVVTVPPAIVYVLWYAAYGRGSSAPVPAPSAVQFLDFVGTGVPWTWELVLRMPGAGGVAIIGFTALVLTGRLTDRQRALALSGMMALAAMFLLIGFSRAGLGADAAKASRYGYFVMLFTLPVAALVLARAAERMAERRTHVRVAAVLLLVLLVGNGVAQALDLTTARAAATDGLRDRLLATERLIADDEQVLNQSVSPIYNPDITVAALARPGVRDALPGGQVSPSELLNTSAALQVAAAADDFGLPAAQAQLRGTAQVLAPGGCADLTVGDRAWIEVPPSSAGSQVRLTSDASTLTYRLVSTTTDLATDKLQLVSTPGEPTYVATTSTRGLLRVSLPAGQVQVCL